MEDVLAAVRVRREGARLVGRSPMWFGTHVFGGILLAQALDAARQSVPADRKARSLHAYFLNAADARVPLFYEVINVKDGRSAHTRAVSATQGGTTVLTMLCSFAADAEGRAYELAPAGDVPDPSSLSPVAVPAPVQFALVGPTPEREDGTRQSTHRAWMRMTTTLPEDPHVHECVLALMGDMSWNGACPWDLSGPPDRTSMVSIDHAMWFHRAARADDWLFFDVQSLVHAGSRGTIRGVLYGPGRHIVCSTAQELQFR